MNRQVCNVPETRFEVRLGQQNDNIVGRKHLKNAPFTEAIVSQAIEPKPDRGGATLILDIDAYRQAELLLAEDDVEARIEETFAELHEFKNEIFFASLSETVIEGFEWWHHRLLQVLVGLPQTKV